MRASGKENIRRESRLTLRKRRLGNQSSDPVTLAAKAEHPRVRTPPTSNNCSCAPTDDSVEASPNTSMNRAPTSSSSTMCDGSVQETHLQVEATSADASAKMSCPRLLAKNISDLDRSPAIQTLAMQTVSSTTIQQEKNGAAKGSMYNADRNHPNDVEGAIREVCGRDIDDNTSSCLSNFEKNDNVLHNQNNVMVKSVDTVLGHHCKSSSKNAQSQSSKSVHDWDFKVLPSQLEAEPAILEATLVNKAVDSQCWSSAGRSTCSFSNDGQSDKKRRKDINLLKGAISPHKACSDDSGSSREDDGIELTEASLSENGCIKRSADIDTMGGIAEQRVEKICGVDSVEQSKSFSKFSVSEQEEHTMPSLDLSNIDNNEYTHRHDKSSSSIQSQAKACKVGESKTSCSTTKKRKPPSISAESKTASLPMDLKKSFACKICGVIHSTLYSCEKKKVRMEACATKQSEKVKDTIREWGNTTALTTLAGVTDGGGGGDDDDDDDDFEVSEANSSTNRQKSRTPSSMLSFSASSSRTSGVRAASTKGLSNAEREDMDLAVAISLSECSNEEAILALEQEHRHLTTDLNRLKRRRNAVAKELQQRRDVYLQPLPTDAPQPNTAEAIAALWNSSYPQGNSYACEDLRAVSYCSNKHLLHPSLFSSAISPKRKSQPHKETTVQKYTISNERSLFSLGTSKGSRLVDAKGTPLGLSQDEYSQSHYICLELLDGANVKQQHTSSSTSDPIATATSPTCHINSTCSGKRDDRKFNGKTDSKYSLHEEEVSNHDIENEKIIAKLLAEAPEGIHETFPNWRENVRYTFRRGQCSLEDAAKHMQDKFGCLSSFPCMQDKESMALEYFIRVLHTAAKRPSIPIMSAPSSETSQSPDTRDPRQSPVSGNPIEKPRLYLAEDSRLDNDFRDSKDYTGGRLEHVQNTTTCPEPSLDSPENYLEVIEIIDNTPPEGNGTEAGCAPEVADSFHSSPGSASRKQDGNCRRSVESSNTEILDSSPLSPEEMQTCKQSEEKTENCTVTGSIDIAFTDMEDQSLNKESIAETHVDDSGEGSECIDLTQNDDEDHNFDEYEEVILTQLDDQASDERSPNREEDSDSFEVIDDEDGGLHCNPNKSKEKEPTLEEDRENSLSMQKSSTQSSSSSICVDSLSIHTACRNGNRDPDFTSLQVVEFIQSRRLIYERILSFESVDIDELQRQLREEGNLQCSKALLIDLLDRRGVTCSNTHPPVTTGQPGQRGIGTTKRGGRGAMATGNKRGSRGRGNRAGKGSGRRGGRSRGR